MDKMQVPIWLLEKQEPFVNVKHQSKLKSSQAGIDAGPKLDGSEQEPAGVSVDQPDGTGSAGGRKCFSGKIIRRGFVEKTVKAIADVMREDFFAEKLAGQPGLLQGIEPRVKVITTLLLIIVAGLTHHAVTLLTLNIWILWLAKVSHIPLKMFIKRIWLVVPLFTGIIVLPSIFNIVNPGDPLLTLFHTGHSYHLGPWTIPETVTITRQGVGGALVLILRAGASVSLAVLLTLTTRWHVLLKALNMVFVPQVFIAVLEMTYRYIYLFLQTASDIFVARQSRSVGRTSTKEQRRFVAGAMGALWVKAFAMSEEVYAAMVSRGYNGTPRAFVNFNISRMDWMWAGFLVFVSLFFLGGDRLFVR